ncbi:MAG: PQQ-binding-like beta-propeller repeat protein [Planctomycetota bacterium]
MKPTSALLVLFPLLAAPTLAQDWPNWRGPSYDGSTEAQNLPVDFDREKGVLWAADMPGPSAGTPIVVGEHVFVSTVDGDELAAMCLDRGTGKVLWKDAAGSGYKPAGTTISTTQLDRRSSYSAPSPVTDGERVVFFFGNGDLVAYDLAGTRLWERNLQKDYGDFAFQWTFSASPTLWDGRLFLAVLQRDEPANERGKEGAESFLLAMDPKTGETLYRHVRPSDAVKESLESYATPIPHVGAEGRKELLVVGGDVITGHDPATGDELWRWGTWNPGHREAWWRIVPSAVVGDGVALVCAPKRAPVYAVPLGGDGTLDQEAFQWRSEGKRNPVSSDVPTPLFYRDRFFVLSDVRAALSRVNPKDGAVEWTTSLPGKSPWRASPTGADGKIWFQSHEGRVVVVDADSGEIVHEAILGEEDADQIRSTVVVAHGRLFIRTNSKLYCIGSE